MKTNKRPTIAIFTGYFLPHLGGVERYVDNLSEALIRLGYSILIVTSNDNNYASVEQQEQRLIYRLPILDVFKQRYPIPRKNKEYRRIIKTLEAEDIQAVIVNTRFHLTSLVGARLGSKRHVPVILIEHGTDHFTVGSSFLDFFGKIYEHILTEYIKQFVDAYYGVSKNCNKWLGHFHIHASGVFYNSIDASYEKRVRSGLFGSKYRKDEIVIAYAGRLIKEKGVLNLLQAYSDIKGTVKNKKTRLVVAGDGPLYDQIRDKYNAIDVNIVGKLNYQEVMSLYQRADIFIHPSLYPEGLPTSLLEAGLMKSAIIATPRGGTEEVIIDESHGLIIDGTVESIQVALVRFINDSELRSICANNVYNRIKSVFNWDATATRVNDAIRSQRG